MKFFRLLYMPLNWILMFFKGPATRSFTRQIKYVIYAFILYILGTLMLMYVHTYHPSMLSLDNDFYISFLASSWEDILFFGMVGLFLALVSLRDPSKEIFVQRIRNLFSFEEGKNTAIENAVIDSVKKVAIYSTKNNIHLTILDYDTKINAFKIQVLQEICLSNLIFDEPYKYERAVDFSLDDFGSKKPSILGRISEASFTDTDLNKNHFCDTQRAFTDTKYSFLIEENIAKGGKGITTLNYWLWYKDGEDWFFKVHHHTEKLNITIVIDDILLHSKCELVHDNKPTMLNGHKHALQLNEFYPINSTVGFKIHYRS